MLQAGQGAQMLEFGPRGRGDPHRVRDTGLGVEQFVKAHHRVGGQGGQGSANHGSVVGETDLP